MYACAQVTFHACHCMLVQYFTFDLGAKNGDNVRVVCAVLSLENRISLVGT